MSGGYEGVRETSQSRLFAADDPPPVKWFNRSGASLLLLTGDHGGNIVPRKRALLGLPPEALERHIGWDIGVYGLGCALGAAIDAAFISQAYSRLVIDCNRDPDAADAIPACSDGTVIPGNDGIDDAEREARIAAIHTPYQDAIALELARRRARSEATILIALHSFTPRMNGLDRPWHIGVLHAGHQDGFARRLLATLAAQDGLVVGDNHPYRMDETDHSIPRHAFAAGLAYAEIEIRQDLLASDAAIVDWAKLLAASLTAAA